MCFRDHFGISVEDGGVGEEEKPMAGMGRQLGRPVTIVLAGCGKCWKQKERRGSGKIQHTQGEKIIESL